MIWRNIFSVRVNFTFFHTKLRKLMQFSLSHFWQKFRESNVFTKELIWRNICFRENKFYFFLFWEVWETLCSTIQHNVEIAEIDSHHCSKFREIKELLYLVNCTTYTVNYFHEIFSRESKFLVFPSTTCAEQKWSYCTFP